MLFVVLFLSLALVALIGVVVVLAATRASAWVVARVEARESAPPTASVTPVSAPSVVDERTSSAA